MFTTQATVERRANKEKRLTEIEGRLESLEERSVVDISPLEVRVAALESATKPVAVDLSPLEGRLATLESAKPVDLSSIDGRLVALESAKPVDLSSIENRLAALESSLETIDATLKALAARSDDHDEIRKRLEHAETNATLVRKELDEMKAVAAKKPVGSTFTTATATKTGTAPAYAFPVKKKKEEDAMD
jgi:chromosome segregation ATPase